MKKLVAIILTVVFTTALMGCEPKEDVEPKGITGKTEQSSQRENLEMEN